MLIKKSKNGIIVFITLTSKNKTIDETNNNCKKSLTLGENVFFKSAKNPKIKSKNRNKNSFISICEKL